MRVVTADADVDHEEGSTTVAVEVVAGGAGGAEDRRLIAVQGPRQDRKLLAVVGDGVPDHEHEVFGPRAREEDAAVARGARRRPASPRGGSRREGSRRRLATPPSGKERRNLHTTSVITSSCIDLLNRFLHYFAFSLEGVGSDACSFCHLVFTEQALDRDAHISVVFSVTVVNELQIKLWLLIWFRLMKFDED